MENDSFSGRAHFSVISDAIVAANDVNRLTIADYTPSLSLSVLGFYVIVSLLLISINCCNI